MQLDLKCAIFLNLSQNESCQFKLLDCKCYLNFLPAVEPSSLKHSLYLNKFLSATFFTTSRKYFTDIIQIRTFLILFTALKVYMLCFNRQKKRWSNLSFFSIFFYNYFKLFSFFAGVFVTYTIFFICFLNQSKIYFYCINFMLCSLLNHFYQSIKLVRMSSNSWITANFSKTY